MQIEKVSEAGGGSPDVPRCDEMRVEEPPTPRLRRDWSRLQKSHSYTKGSGISHRAHQVTFCALGTASL
jgi:hypothetical protein